MVLPKKMGIGKPLRTEHFGAYNKITPDSAADLLRKKNYVNIEFILLKKTLYFI